MTFVEVIHQLSPSIFWKIVSPAENKEIHDISLLENGQTEFAPDILYFGYKEQLQERHSLPSACWKHLPPLSSFPSFYAARF